MKESAKTSAGLAGDSVLGRIAAMARRCAYAASPDKALACAKPLVRPVLGVIFLILGVAGLFLPILQGVLFLFIGLSLIAPYSPFLQRQKDRLEARFPRLAEGERKIKDKLKTFARRMGVDA